MGTGRIFGSIAIFVSVVALATWSGCGGSSNNQGVSFRSLGFFQDSSGSVGESGTCASLRDSTVIPPPSTTGTGLDGGFLGLQNSMISQGINVDHVNLSYFINGSGLAIPNDVFALSVRLGPAGGVAASTVFSQIVIVSPQIFKFLNDNSNRLPDLPFTMVASATAVGTADSGDVFTTNRSTFQVVFTALSGGCTQPTPTPGQSSQG
jgi:hypothetical protein